MMGMPDGLSTQRAFAMWMERKARYKADIESWMREETATYRLWHDPLDDRGERQTAQPNTKG